MDYYRPKAPGVDTGPHIAVRWVCYGLLIGALPAMVVFSFLDPGITLVGLVALALLGLCGSQINELIFHFRLRDHETEAAYEEEYREWQRRRQAERDTGPPEGPWPPPEPHVIHLGEPPSTESSAGNDRTT